jgi:hypothetical protein
MDSLILMAESLCAVDRDVSLHLTVPDAPESLLAWARGRPEVILSTERPQGVTGWDVKPWLLLHHLNQGIPRVLWLDDDIVVTRPISKMLQQFPSDALIFAEEWGRWTVPVSQLWGLKSVRPVELFNNCFIHVSQAHRSLLERWLQMTRDPRYRDAQRLPYEQRPVQAQHDGWLLIALLESEEFCQLQFECIRSGRDIAQCAGSSGYPPLARLLGLFTGLPALIHGLGRKPWGVVQEQRRMQRFLLDFATDVSPYVLASRKVAKKLNMHPEWVEPRTRLGAIARFLTASHPAMAGLPMATVHAAHLGIKRMIDKNE